MAFGLAVYASPGGLPRRDARLASSRWSDATGRASTRRVPTKGFRGVIVTSLPPFPSFAWRNHIDPRGSGPKRCVSLAEPHNVRPVRVDPDQPPSSLLYAEARGPNLHVGSLPNLLEALVHRGGLRLPS